jgi:hypothetical protein
MILAEPGVDRAIPLQKCRIRAVAIGAQAAME